MSFVLDCFVRTDEERAKPLVTHFGNQYILKKLLEKMELATDFIIGYIEAHTDVRIYPGQWHPLYDYFDKSRFINAFNEEDWWACRRMNETPETPLSVTDELCEWDYDVNDLLWNVWLIQISDINELYDELEDVMKQDKETHKKTTDSLKSEILLATA